MPNIFKSIKRGVQDIANALSLTDDRGNLLSVPNKEGSHGVSRTFLPSNNVTSVMTKIDNKNDYPLGFTPPEYFITGATNTPVNDSTGLNVQRGNMQTNASLRRNTAVNKISRTNVTWNPTNASPLDGSVGNSTISYLSKSIPPGLYGPTGIANKYGDHTKISDGFTNPFLYINNPQNKNNITGLPQEFGSYPNNIIPNFNKNLNQMIKTDPTLMLLGDGNIDGIINGIAGAEEVFNFFDNDEQYAFVHNLDRVIPVSGLENPASLKEVYLGSYLPEMDNEDPTIFGYDISIDFANSPLFNGAIIEFINQFGGDEIESRRDVWLTFCKQFFKYFNLDQAQQLLDYTLDKYNSNFPNLKPQETEDTISYKQQQGVYDTNKATTNDNQSDIDKFGTGEFGKRNKEGVTIETVVVTAPKKATRRRNNIKTAKTYYIKKISGLENLVEKDVSHHSDTIKSMIDYGKDIIKLSLYEDVTINMGYLAMLYKTLSWSRLHGRQIIPENLLRFDAKITITEIRDFNRVVKDFNSDDLMISPDLTTKYTYTLYDCQLNFSEMSHGSELDMSSPKMVDSFDLSFNYKYSTLAFTKFFMSGTASSKFTINNKNIDPLGVNPIDGSGSIIDVKDINNANRYNSKQYGLHTKHINTLPITPTSEIQSMKANDATKDKGNKWGNFINNNNPSILNQMKTNDSNKKILNDLGKKLKRAAISEVNRQITMQSRLLNRTLDNIRNSIGLGRMSEPTNVYNNPRYRGIIDGTDMTNWRLTGPVNSIDPRSGPIINDTRNAFRDFIGQSVRGFFGN